MSLSPQKIAPQKIAPQKIAPQKLAPQKIGMLFTYTNRSNVPPIQKNAAYTNLGRFSSMNTNQSSMFSVIHTPSSSCSSCGH